MFRKLFTGLKKWRPTNLSFLWVDSAISPIGKEEVFDAKTVWLGAAYKQIPMTSCKKMFIYQKLTTSRDLKSFCLIFSFSTMASTTKSLWATACSGLVDTDRRAIESERNLLAFSESSCI